MLQEYKAQEQSALLTEIWTMHQLSVHKLTHIAMDSYATRDH